MRALIAALALLALPGAVAAQDRTKPTGEERLAKLLEGRVAAAPVSCINLRALRSSEVIEGTAIVYSSGGSRVYVNRPRGSAADLRDDNILVTRTNGSQLCNTDVVDLRDRFTMQPEGFVLLGDFVPYDRAPRPGS
ncbi:MAG: hypothetical protein WDN24_09110 [Sphingomonas sp.]